MYRYFFGILLDKLDDYDVFQYLGLDFRNCTITHFGIETYLF